MARAKTPRELAPVEEILEMAEPTILLDTGHRISIYAGESLEEALARARRESPEARTWRLQGYRAGKFYYSEERPLG